MILPVWLNRPTLRAPIGLAMYRLARWSNDPLFSDLILAREAALWRHPGDHTHCPSECRDDLVVTNWPHRDWKCCPLWHRKLSNKLNAKRFASLFGVRVARLLWSSRDLVDIERADLPESFVLKSSTGWSSRQVVPVSEGRNLFTGERVTREALRNHFARIMAEPPYDTALLFAEELLSDRLRAPPLDYKCFVFHGRVVFVQVIDRLAATQRWYDRDWRPVRDHMTLSLNWGPDVPRPRPLDALLDAAERLGRGYDYPFVRIDFYLCDGDVVFGEFTHTPLAGPSRLMYTPFGNRSLGRLWVGLDGSAASNSLTESGRRKCRA